MATHCWRSSYEELLALTDLPTLERRRLHLKLGHLFKVVHHQSFFSNGIIILSLRQHSQYDSRSLHSLTLQQPFAHAQSYYHSSVPHTISIWSTLPYGVTSASSCTIFKRLVQSHIIIVYSVYCTVSVSPHVYIYILYLCSCILWVQPVASANCVSNANTMHKRNKKNK